MKLFAIVFIALFACATAFEFGQISDAWNKAVESEKARGAKWLDQAKQFAARIQQQWGQHNVEDAEPTVSDDDEVVSSDPEEVDAEPEAVAAEPEEADVELSVDDEVPTV